MRPAISGVDSTVLMTRSPGIDPRQPDGGRECGENPNDTGYCVPDKTSQVRRPGYYVPDAASLGTLPSRLTRDAPGTPYLGRCIWDAVSGVLGSTRWNNRPGGLPASYFTSFKGGTETSPQSLRTWI